MQMLPTLPWARGHIPHILFAFSLSLAAKLFGQWQNSRKQVGYPIHGTQHCRWLALSFGILTNHRNALKRLLKLTNIHNALELVPVYPIGMLALHATWSRPYRRLITFPIQNDSSRCWRSCQADKTTTALILLSPRRGKLNAGCVSSVRPLLATGGEIIFRIKSCCP